VNKEIRRFADRITPGRWKMILDAREAILENGLLNVLLNIEAEEHQVFRDPDGNTCDSSRPGATPRIAGISGGMLFTDLRERGVDPPGKVAQVVIRLWPYYGDWHGALIHELAHLAVYRWQAWKMKVHLKQGMILIKPGAGEEDDHGRAFTKALSAINRRAAGTESARLEPDRPSESPLSRTT